MSIFGSKITADRFEGSILDSCVRERGKRNRTITVSFRLPESMIEELVKESECFEISPSSTMRKVLGRYLNWDRYRLQAGLVSLPYCFIDDTLSGLSGKEIERIASQCANAFEGVIMLKSGKVDLDSSLRVINEWFRDASINNRFGFSEGEYICIIQHDRSNNWSLFLAEFLAAICRNHGIRDFNIIVNQNGRWIFFSVKRNNSSKVRTTEA
jgi:hypothetical protein